MVKVADLSGAQLDYWVAKAEGVDLRGGLTDDERYSTNWAQGGPIIERERIHAINDHKGWYVRSRHHLRDGDQFYGDTLLVAAMRCYVASYFGPGVPDEK